MENYSYSTGYPDSVHSSPRSRDIIDSETASWDDQQPSHLSSPNYKIKLMCSYGGKIQPRSHDNQLTYVGGDTKILAVERNIKFSIFLSKLSSLCDAEVCFKYQLPGEDLDALISVTNDEDLEHMMLEYDRLYRDSGKPARLRLFLFPLNLPSSFSSSDSKSERQWFVDALNSVQIPSVDDSSSPAAVAPPAATTPDFLFGLDKGHAIPSKVQDSKPAPTVPEVFAKEIRGGSECGSEDRNYVGDPAISPEEIQRQIHELNRMQISNQEQVNPRIYYGDYYGQKITENVQHPANIPAAYWQERHMSTGGYPPASGTELPAYMIPSSAGTYQTPMMRPMTGQVGQGYYGMQRMMPEVYREQPVYNAVQQQQQQPPPFQQPKNIGAYTMGTGPTVEHGYAQVHTQVGYDGAGRQVYYTAPGGVVVQQQYQAADGRQGGGAFNQEGKVVVKAPQTSSM